jgi:hypothetical protein
MPLSLEQSVLLGLGVPTLLFALWAAVFATRADSSARRAARQAEERWHSQIRPQPQVIFIGKTRTPRGLEVQVENAGGAATTSAVLAQAGDEFFAGQFRIAAHAPPATSVLSPALKAWQPVDHPVCRLLAARDIEGSWWDCLVGQRIAGDPRRWLDRKLDEFRLLGVVDFKEPPRPRYQKAAKDGS